MLPEVVLPEVVVDRTFCKMHWPKRSTPREHELVGEVGCDEDVWDD